MAGGGATAYVQAKRASEMHRSDSAAANPGLDDLKVANSNAGSKKQSGVKAKKETQGSREKRRSHKPESRPILDDTDGSEADKTSTIGSVQPDHHNGRRQVFERATGVSRDRDVSEYANFTGAQAHKDVEQGGQQESEREMWERISAEASGGNPAYNTSTMKYQKGDSMPTTTSGRVSETELRHSDNSVRSRHPDHTPTQPQRQQVQQSHPGINNIRCNSHRQPLATNNVVPITTGQENYHPDNVNQGPQLRNVSTEKQEDVGLGIPSEGFSFTLPKKTNARPKGKAYEPQQEFANNPALPALKMRGERAATAMPAQHDESHSIPPQMISAAKTPRTSYPQTQNLPPQQYMDSPHPEPAYSKLNEYGDDQVDNFDGEEVVPTARQDAPQVDLDYALFEILTRSYESLQAADFDTDPKAAPFQVPDTSETSTLAEKLAKMAEYEPGYQAQFFMSLKIGQWEEAGDWFLDQFADIVKQLKSARQEKREAARAFEQEIKGRYNAIGRKRSATESALANMRQHGNAVLQGTPKKLRKKK